MRTMLTTTLSVLASAGASLVSAAIEELGTFPVLDPSNSSTSLAADSSDSILKIDPRFAYQITFQPESISEDTFNMVSLQTAVDLGQRPPNGAFPSQHWTYEDFPGCVITAFDEPTNAVTLTNRMVLYGLFQGVVEMSGRPGYSRAAMTLFWNRELVGLVVWSIVPQADVESLKAGFNETVAGLVSGTNTTSVVDKAANMDDDSLSTRRLRVETRSLGLALTGRRVFLVLMNALVGLVENDVLPPTATYTSRNDGARALIQIGPPNGRPRTRRPYLMQHDAIRSIGRIAQYYVIYAGHEWRETNSMIFLAGIHVADARLRNWNPQTHVLEESVVSR